MVETLFNTGTSATLAPLRGENWNKIENSLEVSAYHHNVLGGFLSLRIGLCSMGKGSVRFKNFVYKAVQ